MRKNRLAQSGPWRRNMGGGVIIQEVIAYRDSEPNAATIPSFEPPAEVSSGAALGGTDMRPALVPALKTSDIEVQLDCTLVTNTILSGGQPINVTVELSDDAGVSWVILGDSEPAAVLPANEYEDPAQANTQRHDFRYRARAGLLEAFPDYVAGEILARATLVIENTSDTTLVSEGTPSNCRVAIREIAA